MTLCNRYYANPYTASQGFSHLVFKSYVACTIISSILQLNKLKTVRVSVTRPRQQHSNNRQNSELDSYSLTLGSSFWPVFYLEVGATPEGPHLLEDSLCG